MTAIAQGQGYNIALKSDGTVWAWGRNLYGELGDGTRTDQSEPVPVYQLGSVSAISAGDQHSLALKSDGTVWAWGYNAFGQLGDGTTTVRITPAQVNGLSGVTRISAGGNASYALTPIVIKLDAPTSGAVLRKGFNYTIRWSASGVGTPTWKFFLNKGAQLIFLMQLSPSSPVKDDDGNWHAQWYIPAELQDGADFDLVVKDDASGIDNHSGLFKITQ